jgi:hypothetical protein
MLPASRISLVAADGRRPFACGSADARGACAECGAVTKIERWTTRPDQ